MDTMEKLQKNGLFLPANDVTAICKKYCINELSIFGSSLRDDFDSKSDVDFLVSFDDNSDIDLFDIMNLERDFSQLVNRNVDIVEKKALRNPIRKNEILSTSKIIYAA